MQRDFDANDGLDPHMPGFVLKDRLLPPKAEGIPLLDASGPNVVRYFSSVGGVESEVTLTLNSACVYADDVVRKILHLYNQYKHYPPCDFYIDDPEGVTCPNPISQ